MQISLPLIERDRSLSRIAIALLAVFAAILFSAPARANPYFATQTGRQCSSCHQQGRETEGIHGLNDTGRAFEQAFRRCPQCALKAYSGDGTGGNPQAHAHRTPSQELTSDMFMQHNGSGITEYSNSHSNVVEFRYSSPRAGLSVKEGTVLFRGIRKTVGSSPVPNVVEGTAYVFRRGCPPAPYAVRGRQTASQIVLHGAAPVRAPHSCKVIGMSSNVKDATLVFDIAE